MAIKSLDKSSIVRPQTTNSMLAGYSFMDYELIESVFLASPAASVTFSNLNQYSTEYKHLQIRMISRLDTSNTARDQLMTFNGVGGTSYSGHRLLGNGSSLSANNRPSSSSMFIGLVDGNQFTAGIIDILDVYEDKNKTVRSFEGADGFAREVMLCSGLFMSTQAITSTTLFPGLNNYGIGSRFSLYGIR